MKLNIGDFVIANNELSTIRQIDSVSYIVRSEQDRGLSTVVHEDVRSADIGDIMRFISRQPGIELNQDMFFKLLSNVIIVD